MTLPKLPVISVKGKPFECGRQYGSQARKQIRKNLELYFDLWKALWGIKRSEVVKRCAGLIPVIGGYDADILEELEGIAKGADVSLEEILALNARYELVFSQSAVQQLAKGGCTSVTALPQATKNGHTLIGQNWDYKPRFQELSLILEVEQEGKPKIITHTEAGIICHKGMNSAGLGICLNALVSNRDKSEPTVPFLIMARGILNADSFSRAMMAVLSARVAVSFNFLIAHRDGEAIDLEVSPVDVGFLHPEGGILTHSNHFIALTNREDLIDMFKAVAPDTLFRAHRARQLLEAEKGQIDVGSFQRVFKDHFSYPNSICRHADPRNEEPQQLATLSSVIMDLTAGIFYFTEGVPCQNEYHKLTPQLMRKIKARPESVRNRP
jgi:isopenicillin-N N-acyltransferase-like protein